MSISESQKARAIALFRDTQATLLRKLAAIDGQAEPVLSDWQRPDGGGGTMGVIRGTQVEKAGANVSEVYGDKYPAIESEFQDQPFFASGVSTITHMYNPHAPIAHMNIRLIIVGDTFWVGGGADLTPCFEYEEDTRDFHQFLKQACESYQAGSYAKYKDWCDQYFYIPHRQSARGVGGVFFDYVKGEFDELYGLIAGISSAYCEVYPKILARRIKMVFTEEQKEEQLYWRGRYAEFNLVYDRGTKFGLQTGGNIDAIFVSLPPVVKW